MSKEMSEYIRELSADYINLTLDYNTYEAIIDEISKILKSRCKKENKLLKIEELIDEVNLNERQRDKDENN